MGTVMSLSISPLSPILQLLALVTVSIILVILIPFTKVEESFSMQSIHDFLFLSDPKRLGLTLMGAGFRNDHFDNRTMEWDHQDFPGKKLYFVLIKNNISI